MGVRSICSGMAAACLASVVVAIPTMAATAADWRHDLDVIVEDISSIHPNAFTKTSRQAFMREAQELKDALPRLTEPERMVKAMQWVALIGDGHTWLEPNRRDFARWYPLRAYEFTDGYFVTAAYSSDRDLVGAEILAVAGHPVDEVMPKVRSLQGSDNVLNLKEHLFAFHSAELMRGLGYASADGSLALTVRLPRGQVVTRMLTPRSTDDARYPKDDSTLDWSFLSEVYGPPVGELEGWTTAYHDLPTVAYRSIDATRPAHFTYRRPFVARPMPEQGAFYIGVNSIGDWEGVTTFAEFFRKALAQVDQLKPRYLIVDLRYNAGGDGSKVTPAIHEFIKREDAPPWQHLYVLTGRKTFSAAVMFLAAFVDHVPCSIVGEPAGAALDSYGDATTIDLPRAGLRLHVSTLWHQLEDQGARYPFMPVDVPAPFSFADYAAGRDPAIDAILAGTEMRSIPLIAIEEGGGTARRVFVERATRYGQYADWMRIREIDLLHAYFKLEDRERHADALLVATMMTDLYPESAVAWGRRGDAEFAVGAQAAGRKSYERALALDPNNLANLEQRNALSKN